MWKTGSKPDQKEEGSGNPAKKAKSNIIYGIKIKNIKSYYSRI